MTRAIGTAERTRRSAASMALATCSPVAVAFTAILAATNNSSGPRCSVLIWMIDSTPSPASAFWIARWCARLALSPMSSDFSLPGEYHGDKDEQYADQRGAGGVP